jgi:hypothetical protein
VATGFFISALFWPAFNGILFNLKRNQDGFIFEKESIEGERIPITRFKIAHHLPPATIIASPGK